MTEIRCPVAQAAEVHKDLPALISDKQTITYGEYDQLVTATAAKLKRRGVAAGERVAIVLPKRIEYPILLMALFRIGAVACPISRHLPEQTVAEYMERTGSSRVVDPANRLETVLSRRIERLPLADVVSLGDVEMTRSGDPFISLDQNATIISTSGTSAHPKAVLHTYGNHYYSAIGSNKNIKVQPGDRWLLSLPLYHVGGLAILFRTLLGGGAVVIANKDVDFFDTIRRHQVTHLSLVSTQLYRLLYTSSLAKRIKGLTALLVGGSAIPKSLIKRAYGSGLPLFTTFGLTEMASQVTTTRPGDPLDRLLTSGKLLEHRQIKISTEGEIMVKGNILFRGYVEHDEVNLPVDSDGWFHTGDIGSLDEMVYLTVKGRKDNMFISGGENIHPEEIEGTLCLLDSVSDAIVVPVEDDEFGFRPVAFVRATGNNRVCKSDLVAGLEQLLPRFKIPVRFYEWPETTPDSRLKPARQRFRELLTTRELTELT